MHSPTLVAIAAILMVTMTLMLLAAWRLNTHIPGLKGWTLAFACGLLVCVNILWRDSSGEWLQVSVTQLSSFLLTWLNLAAARRYLGLPRLPVLAAIASGSMLLASALYFTVVDPNQGARFLLQSYAMGILFLLAGRQMATGGLRHYPARYLYAVICGGHGLFLLLRPWLFKLGQQGMFDSHGTLLISHLVVVETIIAVVLLGFSVVMLANEYVTRELKQMADRDSLTGVYNRRAFLVLLDQLTHYAQRMHFPVSVLLLDLDHFKRINDTWGHQRGDQALCHVVGIAQQCLRDGDVIGRLGGEEFAIALPNASQAEAQQIASRLRMAMAAQPLHHAELTLPLTASIGVASWQGGESPDSLVNRADAAMYQAKSQGRNRIVLAEPIGPQP